MTVNSITGALTERKKPLLIACPDFVEFDGTVARVPNFEAVTSSEKMEAFNYINKLFDNFVLDGSEAFVQFVEMVAVGRGAGYKLDNKRGELLNEQAKQAALEVIFQRADAGGLEANLVFSSAPGSYYVQVRNRAGTMKQIRISDHLAGEHGYPPSDVHYYAWEPLGDVVNWLNAFA